jgi:hypothetical protein
MGYWFSHLKLYFSYDFINLFAQFAFLFHILIVYLAFITSKLSFERIYGYSNFNFKLKTVFLFLLFLIAKMINMFNFTNTAKNVKII